MCIVSSVRKPRWNLTPWFIATRKFLIMFTNIWGPLNTTFIGGNRCFMVFIDDFSKWCWVYTLRHKEKVLKLFMEWKKNMEKNTRRKIKVLHSDNGDEDTSNLFLRLCRNEAIERQFRVRETPQQKGVAERINMILLEKVPCMSSNVELLKSF